MSKGPDANSLGNDFDLQRRLGLVVSICRQHLGITQEELAGRSSMHRTYIADIERGARNVTLRTLANLARALEVTLENLISYSAAPAESGLRLDEQRVPTVTGDILLVEDSATDSAVTVRTFQQAKLTNRIKIVRDGEDGLAYLFGTGRHEKRRPARPQLILLDLNLPKMSGLEFLRRVKGDDRTDTIPVVMLAASRNDRSMIECGRLGAENFLIKPLGIESLVRVTPRLNLHLTIAPAPLEGLRSA